MFKQYRMPVGKSCRKVLQQAPVSELINKDSLNEVTKWSSFRHFTHISSPMYLMYVLTGRMDSDGFWTVSEEKINDILHEYACTDLRMQEDAAVKTLNVTYPLS